MRPMRPLRRAQSGVVLFIALIILVAMTLAGIALMRSVDTNVLIAGNLAFRQATTLAGDWGIEEARSWLTANTSGETLYSRNPVRFWQIVSALLLIALLVALAQ